MNPKPKADRATIVKRLKRVLTIVTLLLPILYLMFIIPDRLGFWDWITGLELVENVSDRFQSSYRDYASRPVLAGDKEWKPLLRLLRTYSTAKFRTDQEPGVFARAQATLATRTPATGPIEFEWTAPSTAIYLLYCNCGPASGVPIRQEDIVVVGTIGDLTNWISEAKDRRRFFVQDVFLGIFGPLLGILILWIDKRAEK